MALSWVGKTIGGRYQIEALLGQGGMSAVYRATDPNLRRLVAIKLIHPHLSNDPNFIGRFKEEAAAVARLRHPNIVQVHDFNTDGETYYMVMEYLVGETLQARLKRLNATGRRMQLEEALRLCIQVCEAAGYAHDHELVHRDIKPANIMLNVNGQAILMDFGIVKIIGGDYHTATGATIGTAVYMSPEQIRSERIDDRADIYSLGVTLYEMITGRPPFMADSAMTLMMMVLNDPLPDIREVRSDVPASLAMATNRALARNSSERFQTMAEMAVALRQVLSELAGAPRPSVSTLVDEVKPEPAPPISTTPPIAAPLPLPTLEERPAEAEISQTLPEAPDTSGPARAVGTLPDRPTAPTPTLPDAQPGAEPYARPEPEPEAPPKQARPVKSKDRSSAPRFSPPRVSRRAVWVGVGVLAVLVLAAAGFFYVNNTKLPNIQLTPISLPAEVINAATAQSVVNIGSWNIDSGVEEIKFSPDGSLLGTVNNRDWKRYSRYRFYGGLWQVQAGMLENYLLGLKSWVSDGGFSPDGTLFGAASDDGSMIFWQVSDGVQVRTIAGDFGGFTSLAFSPNNLLLAAGSWDGTVSLWQVSNGNLLRTLHESDNGIRDIEFSPDGTLVAAASDDKSVQLWRVSDGSLVQTLSGHEESINEVVFSWDGALLASASDDKSVKIWQVSDGSLLHILEGHTEAVYDVAFSVDGSLLASASGDATLRLWQVSDGTFLRTLTEYSDAIKSVAFSPTNRLLVSAAGDGAIQFWGFSEAISPEGK